MSALDPLKPTRHTPIALVTEHLLPGLFATRHRWGWEYRAPDVSPLPVERTPSLVVPAPRALTAACRLYERLPPRSATVLAVLLTACAVVLADRGAAWDARLRAAERQSGFDLRLAAWPPYLLLAAAVLAVWAAMMAFAVRRTASGWMADAVEAHRLQATAMKDWADEQERIREREDSRQRKQPQWFAIRPDVLRRLDVFGGAPDGWRALLLSAGCPLLGAGGEVVVVDLSQDDVARALLHAAEARGLRHREVALPEKAALTDVFGGLSPQAVADVLMETAQGSGEQIGHAQRSMDARLLGAVCGALDPPLTVSRICAALRVLLHQEPPPGAPGAELGEEEYDRVAALFADSYLQHAAGRVTALESLLHPLTVFSRADEETHPLHAPDSVLQVIRITEATPALSAEATAHFVLQLLLSDMRDATDGHDRVPVERTLVVAAADDLRENHLEKLAQVARQRGIRLILLFRHLRGGAEKLLGGGDTTYFMRLGNAAEAARAAEFIGREHRFVIHQSSLAVNLGSSDSVSTGRSVTLSRSVSTSPAGGSHGASSSTTTSSGTTSGESYALTDSAARQRVYEFAVEPSALQALPDAVFVFLDPSRRDGPRARVGSCDPALVELDITLDDPAEVAGR